MTTSTTSAATFDLSPDKAITGFSFEERLDAVRETKMRHTREKWDVIGAMDFDDHPIILPPEGYRDVVEVVGGPGILINDALFTAY